MEKLKVARQTDIRTRTFWMVVVLVVLAKMFLSQFQMVYIWIDGAPLDDELMFRAAQSITAGNWLGAYDWLTLSKHMLFPVWAALCHALHIPFLAAGQVLACAAALACTFAFAPVVRRNKSRLILFLLLAFNPAISGEFALRFYRDNIFPALCMFFFAGICGYALRCRAPLHKGLPWLILAGVGFACAWLTREDGMWLMPFAVVGSIILVITALRDQMPALQKALRCGVLLVPFALLLAGIWSFSAINQAYYGVFAVSDFSSGSFAEAMGAMNRVEAEVTKPRVSVPESVRRQLYQQVPELAPLEPWLEEDGQLRNSYLNRKLNDYQAGSFYWVVRKAAAQEGVYDSAPQAEAYWKKVAEQINAKCDDGTLPSNGGKRVGTAPPIRPEHVVPTLAEGVKSVLFTLTFQGCIPYDPVHLSLGPPEDLAAWENYLGNRTNHAAQAGTALPYYSSLQRLVFAFLNGIRWLYALAVPVLFVAAVVIQIRHGLALWVLHKEKKICPGDAMLWTLLLGLLGMALLRCFMIAFMEVSSFGIGTYAMYLSTVHPLMLLYIGVGILTIEPKNKKAD